MNVLNSLAYKNSHDVDASLFRGSGHLKKDECLGRVCACSFFRCKMFIFQKLLFFMFSCSGPTYV